VTAFGDRGGNVLVAGASRVSSELRKLAHAYGADFDAPLSRVIDHFSFEPVAAGEKESNLRVLSSAFFPSRYVIGDKIAARLQDRDKEAPKVAYEGIGLTVASDNILALPILTASRTGYSANPEEAIKDSPQSAGAETVLVAGIQARNNARGVFTGSLWMFSDAALKGKLAAAGNKRGANNAFTSAIAAWAFQDAGVLRVTNLRHTRKDGSAAEIQGTHALKEDLPLSMFPHPEIAEVSRAYRIKDDLVFAVDIHEYAAPENATAADASQVWKPYAADDVQLEFVMLDPYVRKTLQHNGKGSFFTEFKAPDVYGIFHFRVQYRRKGLSVLTLKDQVTLRPFLHNEYERYIVSAYPYYAGAFSMMAGVFIFAILFLYSSDKPGAAAAASAASIKTKGE
jgi:oligosaccharyltransferase complex subunit beta